MWQQRFHPGCQKCTLRVYLNSLRDVGIRSDITWRETLFEPWRKNFGLFVKIALYVSKMNTFSKKSTFESSDFFFKLLRFLNEHSPCLAKKFLGRDIKIENCKLRLKRSNKKSNFWKIYFFFQNLQNFQRTFAVFGEKVLGRGIEKENCTLCLQSINLRMKIFFWKFCKFSFVSDLKHETFGFVATEFSPELSKLYSTCLYEFSLRCWY